MNLLLRLIIAHLLTDFIIQPKSWVRDREEQQGRSTKLYLHVLVTAIVAYLLSGLYTNWVIPVVIFFSHLLIDYLKSKTDKNRFSYFMADQIAHLLVIVVLWLSIEDKWPAIAPLTAMIIGNDKFWIIVTGYLFVSFPLGIIIGKATQKWRDQISREKERSAAANPAVQHQDTENSGGLETVTTQSRTEQPVTAQVTADQTITDQVTTAHTITGQTLTSQAAEGTGNDEEQELGLANAGKWIGICERILILTFVLMGQFTAIGFLMTAKSILRFSEKEANTQLKTEYILVGTLVSFASSAMVGVLMHIALTN